MVPVPTVDGLRRSRSRVRRARRRRRGCRRARILPSVSKCRVERTGRDHSPRRYLSPGEVRGLFFLGHSRLLTLEPDARRPKRRCAALAADRFAVGSPAPGGGGPRCASIVAGVTHAHHAGELARHSRSRRCWRASSGWGATCSRSRRRTRSRPPHDRPPRLRLPPARPRFAAAEGGCEIRPGPVGGRTRSGHALHR